ncbi:helix-turn-helix domain-containing protein [Nonomuraea sp. WAC 01424]|uniref:AraC-like ligand-binding domain-containing protein n=1 Tax=Nonomuraea sp. WAC 01424 TaxID=2203200 RepID=UPI001C8B87AD|nr:helix-turn-helix domain-containing protein [Nonomuraea sp. WAC 01424]
MGLVTLHSTDLPPGERFDWWCDLISRDVAPIRVASGHAADFRASAGAIDLDAVQLTTMSFPALSSVRTPALIRRSDPERYELALIAGSTMWISQGGNDTRMAAGDLVMWDTSRPYEGGAFDGPSPARAIIVHLPKSELPLPSGKVDALVAGRMPAGGGIGAILASYLKTLVREASSMSLPDVKRLGAATLDMALAFVAHRLNAQDRLSPETRDLALMARIREFVEHNLGDPGLTPHAVAQRHHISVRYLQLLFQRQGTTLTAWIRRRRLEHCRADLADPRLAGQPINVIAARWGFPRAADLSRSFRAKYGLPPKDYRHEALTSAVDLNSG